MYQPSDVADDVDIDDKAGITWINNREFYYPPLDFSGMVVQLIIKYTLWIWHVLIVTPDTPIYRDRLSVLK